MMEDQEQHTKQTSTPNSIWSLVVIVLLSIIMIPDLASGIRFPPRNYNYNPGSAVDDSKEDLGMYKRWYESVNKQLDGLISRLYDDTEYLENQKEGEVELIRKSKREAKPRVNNEGEVVCSGSRAGCHNDLMGLWLRMMSKRSIK